MPVRTTSDKVAAIIEWDADIPLDPFISVASTLVDRVERAANSLNLLLDDPDTGGKSREDKLTEIETFLAAHFYTLRDPRPASESAGPVSTSYQSAVMARPLSTSHYGMAAMALDETGTLTAIDAGKPGGPRKVGVFWGGKRRTAC